jgi:hypothetical protein
VYVCTAVGVNPTLTEHELPMAIDPVQLLSADGTVNAALFEAIEAMTSVALPQFVTWTVCDAVLPGGRKPNESPEAAYPPKHNVPVEVEGSISET